MHIDLPEEPRLHLVVGCTFDMHSKIFEFVILLYTMIDIALYDDGTKVLVTMKAEL